MRTGDRALLVDSVAVGAISVAILVASDRLLLMTVLVPAVIAARMIAFLRLPRRERGLSVPVELAFFAVCTALGAFNDWSSVVRHGVYDYGVPVYFPEVTTIPLWMLLYWGMILRFVATLARSPRLGSSTSPRDEIHLPGRTVRAAWIKVAIELALVLATRQAIYRLYDEPVLSFVPFAAALLAWLLLFRPDRGERRLALLFGIGGPIVEILYIQVGGLHRYEHGVLFGVPIWIALWWVLAVLVFSDLTLRASTALRTRACGTSAR